MLGIYIRVSTTHQVEKGKSLSAQESLGIAKAKDLGKDYKLFKEEGKSAKSEKLDNRPVIGRLLDECQKGVLDSIFVVDEDRLSRNMQSKYIIKGIFKENGIRVYTPNGEVDYNDIDDDMLSDLRTLLAQREINQMSRNISRVLESNVKAGGVGSGASIPYGYMNDEKMLAVHEADSKVVRKIFELSIQGYGTKKIAGKLNRERIPSPKGKKWRDGTIYNILLNTTYIGKRIWKDEVYNCPRIISDETFEKSQSKIAARAEGVKNASRYHYLLNDLVRCGKCGRPMRGRRNIRDGSNIYKCTSARYTGGACGNKSINRPMIEKLTEQLMSIKIRNQEGVYSVGQWVAETHGHVADNNELDLLKSELAGYEKNIGKIKEALSEPDAEFEPLYSALRSNRKKASSVQKKVEAFELAAKHEEMLDVNDFLKFDFDLRRKVLKSLIKEINVEFLDGAWGIEYLSVYDNAVFFGTLEEKGDLMFFMTSPNKQRSYAKLKGKIGGNIKTDESLAVSSLQA